MRMFLRLASVVTCALVLGKPARAQLSFTLTPSVVSAPQGSSLTFAGTIENSSTNELFLNGASYTLAGTGFRLDPGPFLLNGPLSLAGGASYTGDFFDLALGFDPVGRYDGEFSILGGPDPSGTAVIGTAGFAIELAAAPPTTARRDYQVSSLGPSGVTFNVEMPGTWTFEVTGGAWNPWGSGFGQCDAFGANCRYGWRTDYAVEFNGILTPFYFGTYATPELALAAARPFTTQLTSTGPVHLLMLDNQYGDNFGDVTITVTGPVPPTVPDPTTAPEPATFALVCGGLLGLGAVARRRRVD
jgi:hypothetical protein